MKEITTKKMGETEGDDRFTVISHDPRFRRISQKARKVKIDKRFQGMFKEDNFKLKYTVDKRGRPVNLTSDKHLRKFYELSSSDSEDEGDAGEAEENETGEGVSVDSAKSKRRLSGRQKLIESLRKKTAKRKMDQNKSETLKSRSKISLRDESSSAQHDAQETDSSDDSSDSGPSPLAPSRLSGRKGQPPLRGVDLARGQGNVESSSDSNSDSDSDSDYGGSNREEQSEEEGETVLQWGELDRDARRSEDQSSRLALCNMDWDRVTARDLLVLFNSFKPTGGVIHSVKIYPSDFGLEKMRQEDARGPAELLDNGGSYDEMTAQHNEDALQNKLRKYQLQRLRYYYAVIECDSVETASALYDHCDGMEYQSSSTKLDLRFIPDDVTFDHKPKEELTELPDASLYKPTEFRTFALHQSKVELTWDETSHQRTVRTAEAFKAKSIEDMDVSAYLASSSDEEGEERWELDFAGGGDTDQQKEARREQPPLSEDQQIAKYRALLKAADNSSSNQAESDKQMEMEITWEPGLKDTAEELLKKKSERAAEPSPWDRFLEKKKEKKKKKQKGAKKEDQNEGVDVMTSQPAFSDDELPNGVDLNDSYFKDALKDDGFKGSKTKKGKKLKGKKEEAATEEDAEKVQQEKSELELLFMDNEDGKKHFNLKQIMESEKAQGKKAKRKRKKRPDEAPASACREEDDFKINVRDDRFQALFTSHLYAMDPSDPQFKKTKATEALLAERLKRRQNAEEAPPTTETATTTTPIPTPTSPPQIDIAKPIVKRDVELSMLVKSVKNKTDQFKERKLKRQKIH